MLKAAASALACLVLFYGTICAVAVPPRGACICTHSCTSCVERQFKKGAPALCKLAYSFLVFDSVWKSRIFAVLKHET